MMSQATHSTHNPPQSKALKIIARSLFKELKQAGYDSGQIVSLSGELIGLVTTDLSSPHVAQG